MSDPIRHKDISEIWMDAKYHIGESETSMRFYARMDKTVKEKLTEEQIKEMLERDIKMISPTPVSGIYNNISIFSYVNKDALKDFDYGNTLVEIHIPYCLHIPNEYEFEINIPEEKMKALATLRKIWTTRAMDEGKSSSHVDFFAEDRTLYFQKSAIVGPKIPLHPEQGWEPFYTGTNIEKIKGQDGTFRFTLIYLQFDYTPTIKKLETESFQEEIEKVKEMALVFVNRMIDCYRAKTRQEHIQRLGFLSANMVYFKDFDKGYYLCPMGRGIETAPMNRSRQEIISIEKTLGEGERPDLYDLLLLDAKSSYDGKNYALAVVQSFQALEIFLEQKLLAFLSERGDSSLDIKKYLDQHWRTKERLKECMKELKKTCLSDSDKNLWDQWCFLYQETRNEIVHKGKEPKQKEVSEMLEVNLKVISWLKGLV